VACVCVSDYPVFVPVSGYSAVYLWTGLNFTLAGHLPVSNSTNLAAFVSEDAVYFAIAAPLPSSGTGVQEVTVKVARWLDATEWLGALHYSNAFTPRAAFVVRELRETTLVASANRSYVATMRPDRRLPAGMTTYNALQRTATHCNALQRTATHCNALQRTADTLHHTASH